MRLRICGRLLRRWLDSQLHLASWMIWLRRWTCDSFRHRLRRFSGPDVILVVRSRLSHLLCVHIGVGVFALLLSLKLQLLDGVGDFAELDR